LKRLRKIEYTGTAIFLTDELRQQLEILQHESQELQKKELEMDQTMQQHQLSMQNLFSKQENYKQTFITHSDIRKIPDFTDETILAIKAPPGTKMDIPTNGPSTRYQILLTSQKDPIDVYIVPDVTLNPPVIDSPPDPPRLTPNPTSSSSSTLTGSTTSTLNNSVVVEESLDQSASVGVGKSYSLLQNELDDYYYTLCQPSEGIAEYYTGQDWND